MGTEVNPDEAEIREACDRLDLDATQAETVMGDHRRVGPSTLPWMIQRGHIVGEELAAKEGKAWDDAARRRMLDGVFDSHVHFLIFLREKVEAGSPGGMETIRFLGSSQRVESPGGLEINCATFTVSGDEGDDD